MNVGGWHDTTYDHLYHKGLLFGMEFWLRGVAEQGTEVNWKKAVQWEGLGY